MDLLYTSATPRRSTLFDRLFRIGMWWRIFYGSLRFLFGLALLRFIDVPLSDALYSMMHHELVDDPQDFFMRTIHPFLANTSYKVTYFLAIYIFFWGFVDVALSIGLLRHKVWAFTISLYLITIFMLYEIYRFFHTYSLVLIAVIAVDLLVMWLIRKEYNNLKAHLLRNTPDLS